MIEIFTFSNVMWIITGDDPTKWYPKDGGWAFHVASTVSEWVCAGAFNIFMLTLVDEFKCISMDPPQVRYYECACTLKVYWEFDPVCVWGAKWALDIFKLLRSSLSIALGIVLMVLWSWEFPFFFLRKYSSDFIWCFLVRSWMCHYKKSNCLFFANFLLTWC